MQDYFKFGEKSGNSGFGFVVDFSVMLYNTERLKNFTSKSDAFRKFFCNEMCMLTCRYLHVLDGFLFVLFVECSSAVPIASILEDSD